MQNIKMKITLVLGLALVAFMVSGSSLSSGSAMGAYATSQTIPSCTDPTGQNLRCMMVISTLPPPPNALQCQETSGQLLPCSYTTQNLSNGEQIVAITVYVPTSYLFTGYGSWTVVKQVVHKTTRVTIVVKDGDRCPETQFFNHTSGKCQDNPKTIKPPIPCKDNYSCPTEGNTSSINMTQPTNSTTPPTNMTVPQNHTNYSSLTNTTIPSVHNGTPASGPRCNGNCTLPPVTGTTQTCPDGSVIDSTAKCPTQPTPTPTPSVNSDTTPIPPPIFTPAQPSGNGQSGTGNNNPPPSPDNSNPPPSSDKGNSDNGNGGNDKGSSHISHIPTFN
jgi:hypothetical protein